MQRPESVRRRYTLASSIAAMTALCGLAFGGADVQAAEVEFWSPFTGPDGSTIEKMVADYNATVGKEKNATVNLLIVPWDQYYTKLTVALASRRAPDLAIAHSHRIAGFVKQGALTAFSPEALAEAGVEGSSYVPVLWAAGEVDGKRYAVPIDAFPRNIYWNKAVFEKAGLDPDKPPQNLAELKADALKIKALGPDVTPIFFRMGGSWVPRDFYTVYWQYTDDLLSKDQKDVAPGFADAATKALDTVKGLIDAGLTVSTDIETYESLFVQNRLGIAFSQITELPLFKDTSGLEWGIAPVPVLGDRPATFALGHNFIIPTGTGEEESEAALTFIKWFGAHSIEWVAAGKVPASKEVLESADFKALKAPSIVASQLDYMHLPPVIAQQPEIDRIVQENVEKFYAGRQTTAQAVEQMARGIKQALAK